MALTLPSDFVDLPTAKERYEEYVNIMGVAVDYMSPKQTKGGSDWVMTFTLRDPQWEKHPFMSGQGLGCRYFSDPSRLPRISSNGDVVVLQKVKIIDWNQMRMALSSRNTIWHILPARDIQKRLPNGPLLFNSLPDTLPLSKEQVNYALQIHNGLEMPIVISENPMPVRKPPSLIADRAVQESPAAQQQPKSVRPAGREKFSFVQDIRLSPEKEHCFVDLVGEVRKIYSNGGRTELYISDYTANKQLFEYSHGCDEDGREGDEFAYIHSNRTNWPGPWGKMTLQITAWNLQANFVNSKLKMGNFVLLQNVHVKLSPYRIMEGNLRDDPRFPEKVLVTILDLYRANTDGRLKEMLRRRKDYEHKSKKQINSNVSCLGQKRPLHDNGGNEDLEDSREADKPKDKKQRKREKRRQQKLAERERANAAKVDSNSHGKP